MRAAFFITTPHPDFLVRILARGMIALGRLRNAPTVSVVRTEDIGNKLKKIRGRSEWHVIKRDFREAGVRIGVSGGRTFPRSTSSTPLIR